jgi:hypothetical protein
MFSWSIRIFTPHLQIQITPSTAYEEARFLPNRTCKISIGITYLEVYNIVVLLDFQYSSSCMHQSPFPATGTANQNDLFLTSKSVVNMSIRIAIFPFRKDRSCTPVLSTQLKLWKHVIKYDRKTNGKIINHTLQLQWS